MGSPRKRDPFRMECSVRAALDVLKGRWKPSILFELKDRPRRFSELQAALPKASAQALSAQLRQLEEDGVVARKVFADSPVRVEYSITEFGATLASVMDGLEGWGAQYIKRQA